LAGPIKNFFPKNQLSFRIYPKNFFSPKTSQLIEIFRQVLELKKNFFLKNMNEESENEEDILEQMKNLSVKYNKKSHSKASSTNSEA